jgi:hypothetical protein
LKWIKQLYRGWMKFADALAWINTRILLTVIYYLVVTPTGAVMRLFGKSPLDADGNWRRATPHSYGDKHFEKQF